MANDIPGINHTPTTSTLDNENAKFAERNGKTIVRVEDEEGVDLLTQILAALGGGSTAVWTRLGPVTIPATTTLVVDTNLLVDFSRIDYILNFKDDPVTVTKSLKLVAQNNAGSVSNIVSERLGGPIDVAVAFTDDGIDGFLEVTNNEAFDVTLTFLRAITL